MGQIQVYSEVTILVTLNEEEKQKHFQLYENLMQQYFSFKPGRCWVFLLFAAISSMTGESNDVSQTVANEATQSEPNVRSRFHENIIKFKSYSLESSAGILNVSAIVADALILDRFEVGQEKPAKIDTRQHQFEATIEKRRD